MANNNQVRVRRKPNPTVRLVVWKVVDFVATFLPITIFIIVQWDEYFGKSSEYAWNNVLGLSSLLLFIGLTIGKKLKLTNLLGVSGILTLIFYLLQQIIGDLVVIGFMVFIGSLISKLITTPLIKKWERLKDKMETANINANSLENIVEKVIARSGRV